MPAVNPFIDPGTNLEAIDGSPVAFAPSAYTLRQQDPRPGALAQGFGALTGMTSSTHNAAGTQEHVAMHVAVIVVLAIVGVWALRQSGFKFVVAGSVG